MEQAFDLNFDNWIVILLSLIPGIISAGIFFYVYYKLPKSLTTNIFSAFIISASMWQIGESLVRMSATRETALMWNGFVEVFVISTITLGIHFSLIFTKRNKIINSAIVRSILYFPAFAFISMRIIAPNTIDEIGFSQNWGWISAPSGSLRGDIEITWLSLCGLITFISFASYAWKVRKLDRSVSDRAIIIAVGYFIPFILGVVAQAILPYAFGMQEIPFTTTSIVAFSIATVIALNKYQLFVFTPEQAIGRIIESIDEGIAIIDNHGIIKYCNDRYAEITGYPIGRLIEQRADKFYVGKNALVCPDFSFEREIVARNAEKVDVMINQSPYLSSKGNKIGMICIHTDITERKKAVAKLEQEQKQTKQFHSMLLSSQINPHFIFNSLNSIQYYILDQSPEPALNYLAEFSRLMRTVLGNSLHKYITIEEELKFLTMYLNLEKQRFTDKFDYKFIIDEEIDEEDMLIPPMLLQPYVENTVIHGIGPKEGKGEVEIIFKLTAHYIVCSIKDNGVGRKKAEELKAIRENKKQKSLGMGITKTRLDLLNNIEQTPFSVKIVDLEDEIGNATGTMIEVQFPNDLGMEKRPTLHVNESA